MKFVSSYRKLTRLPTPNKKSINIEQFLSNVSTMMTQTGLSHDNLLSIVVEPKTLEFEVDVAMMEQVFINLLKNAQQALKNNITPKINIHAKQHMFGAWYFMFRELPIISWPEYSYLTTRRFIIHKKLIYRFHLLPQALFRFSTAFIQAIISAIKGPNYIS